MALLQWTIPKPPPTKFVGYNPDLPHFVVQYLWNHGYTNLDYIKALFGENVLHDINPLIMKDMRKAVDRIWEAIQKGQLICIYGDYDADGITGVATMYRGLLGLGANLVRYTPNRKYGYGASAERVKSLVEENPSIELFVSVDNGIKATEAVSQSVSLGIDFIVTDHHNPDYEDFPHDAYAVINPMQDDCPYPNPYLSGCAVAYKVIHAMGMVALWEEIESNQKFNKLQDALKYANESVQDVAIGLVADMMPLASLENRSLVKRGMSGIQTNPSIGIEALCTSEARGRYKIDYTKLSTEDIGFGLGPPMNATGRLTDPTIATDLLLSTHKADAHQLAYQVIGMNNERKRVQKEFYEQVLATFENTDMSRTSMPIIIAKVDDCPKGIVGLIAGNLTEKYRRPSAVLAKSGTTDDGEIVWTASARSIVGFDIESALSECRKYLERFGGHSAAAGFSILESNIIPFEDAMKKVAFRELGEDEKAEVQVDFEMSLAYITMDTLDAIERLSPFGSADIKYPKIVSRNLVPVDYMAWSASKAHLRGKVADKKGNFLKFNGWGFAEWANDMPSEIDIVYTLGTDTYGADDNNPFLLASLTALQPSESQERVNKAQRLDPERRKKILSRRRL